jgi:lipid-A-disaccharide synthase
VANDTAKPSGTAPRMPAIPPRDHDGPRVMIVAGEDSGDRIACGLVRELLALIPTLRLYGLGGARMAEAGVAPMTNIVDHLAITGFTGVVRNYNTLRGLLGSTYEALERDRPDAVILVDYPGFNQRVAERASELGIPVIYYVCPQFWAWNEKRKFKLARIVDLMMVIFPFEVPLCREVGINAHYVGHPMLDWISVEKSREEVCVGLGIAPKKFLLGLLPGSRRGEVTRLLPVMLDGAERLRARMGDDVEFVLVQATTISDELIAGCLGETTAPVTIVKSDRENVRAALDFAWVASGTATLETAILNTPLLLIYQVSFLTWVIGQRLVRTPYIGLVNIVAEDRIVPELLQDRATGENLVEETLAFVNDPARMQDLRDGLARVRGLIGGPGAARHAAETVRDYLSHLRPLDGGDSAADGAEQETSVPAAVD